MFAKVFIPGFIFVAGLSLFNSFKLIPAIVLKDEPLPFKPDGFYISAVTDNRINKEAIAQLIIKGAGNKTTAQPADLQGGAASGIATFLEHNLPKDISLRPVTIGINEFKLTETPLPDGSVDGRIKLSLSFDLQKDDDLTEHLVDYNGGLHYTRPVAATAMSEQELRTGIKNALVYFNNWMKNNLSVNRKLATKVKISFSDYKEKEEGDTIYYSPKRPLTWSDFRSTLSLSGVFAAEIMPGIGYDEQAEVKDGSILVKINLKTFLPKSTCWARRTGRTNEELAHEQRHFDIARIIASRFEQKILNEPLTPGTFEAFINMQYLDSYHDLDTMQKAYDKETDHSRNSYAQQQWNLRIEKELALVIGMPRS